MTVVATAGHVDHGKSTLVKALTGVDPDRWRQEKERGLTIDLGFALARLAPGLEVSFVDVPGHVRFLKNMLAGVGAVQACLFVVDAREGWKPQSEEHLRILELLGLGHGIVALTKVGGLDPEEVELARLEVAEAVKGTFLEAAPAVAVDSITGEGIEGLRQTLAAVVREVGEPPGTSRPRLWVDRSFAAKGSGTVCTGTLSGGSISVDDELEVVGRHSRTVRVRALQSHGKALRSAPAASRVAINLAGIGHKELLRGDALVRAGQWAPSRVFDATLAVLGSLSHEVSRRGAYLAYVGSGEHPARLRVLGPSALSPGESGLVRLWLDMELPLLPGDRYVLRESGRNETVGGGEILDIDPVLPASRAAPDRNVERVIAERGWISVDQVERLTGTRPQPLLAGKWVASRERFEADRASLAGALEAAGASGLALQPLSEQERAIVASMPGVEVKDGLAYRAGIDRPDPNSHPLVAKAAKNPFAPEQPAASERAEARRLARAGALVDCEGLFFTPAALGAAAETVSRLLDDSPGGVTVSEVRQALGTSRKYLLALLARLDSEGVTRRRGDLRVRGPRMGRPAAKEAGTPLGGQDQASPPQSRSLATMGENAGEIGSIGAKR